MLDILLYPGCTMDPPWSGPGKNFQSISSQMAGKRYFEFDSCK